MGKDDSDSREMVNLAGSQEEEESAMKKTVDEDEPLSFRYALGKFQDAFLSSITNRYLLANFVYLGYAIGIVFIDYGTANYTTDEINHLFIGFNFVHLISAFLYAWAWRGFPYIHIIMIPEFLNVCEAVLYITSSFYYNKEDTDTYLDHYTFLIHNIETAACVISCVASFGWVATWWLTYLRTPGRGWTIDDPDVIAWNCTLSAALVYVVYNAKVQMNPEIYATEFMYTNADIVYLVGACFYVFAAMRDDGWWWFMPLAGQFGLKIPTVAGDGSEEGARPPPNTVRGFLYRCGWSPWPKSWTLGGWKDRLC